MKKIILALILLSSCLHPIEAQTCYPDGVYLFSQNDVDNFPASCTHVLGDVIISGQIANLNGLSNIEQISGNLIFEENTQLQHCYGLEKLEIVRGNFVAYDCEALIDFLGILSLKHIGGHFELNQNDKLYRLQGLSSLQTIGGMIHLLSNPSLDTLADLKNLVYVGEDIIVNDNDELDNLIGLHQLDTIRGDLIISGNDQLYNFASFDSLRILQGDLKVIGNGNLQNLMGINRLHRVDSTLEIKNNPELRYLIGLEQVHEIGKHLWVYDNPKLVDLYGLSRLNDLGADLHIYDNDMLQNFEGLNNLIHINGDLFLKGNKISSLDGITNIREIEGDCSISNCNELLFLSGYNGALLDFMDLEKVGGSLNIIGHPKISSLYGLWNIDTIGGTFLISSNHSMTWTRGMDDLKYVGGLNIDNHALLEEISLDSLNIIDGDLVIRDNPKLGGFTYPVPITAINGDFILTGNAMHSIGSWDPLKQLTYIGGDLDARDTELWDFEGLKHVKEIGGSIYVLNNRRLRSMNGLEGLEKIGGDLNIASNYDLKGLHGLINLTEMNGRISVRHHEFLSTIGGLDNIDPFTISEVELYGNEALFYCAVPSICQFEQNGGAIDLGGNLTGCNTINELIAACASPTEEALAFELTVDVFPNPAEDLITIELNQPGIYQVEFYNTLGQLIRLSKVVGARRTFNIAAFDRGLYFAIVSSGNGVAELIFEKQ